MRAFSSDKTKGGAKMKKLSKKGKIILLGVLSASLVSCSPVVNRDIGLYPLNSPEVQKDCPPFPKNVWGDPRLYTALDPIVVLEKPEVKVRQWNISKDYISYLVEIPYALKEYVQKYGSEKFSEMSLSSPRRKALIEMHLRFVRKGDTLWYPYKVSYLERDLTDAYNYYKNLDVPSKAYFASSVVKRNPSDLDRRTDYPTSMSLVAKGLVTDKDKAFCLEVDLQGQIYTETTHVFEPGLHGYKYKRSISVPVKKYVYTISQIHSNKTSFVESPRYIYSITSIDTEKGSDRALFLKVFTNGLDMVYRMQCLLKEDIEFYLQKNPLAKSNPYLSVCGDGVNPFFICMEFKDAVCYVAEKLNYKSLAEHLYGGGSSLLGEAQAIWFRNLLEEKLQERQK